MSTRWSCSSSAIAGCLYSSVGGVAVALELAESSVALEALLVAASVPELSVLEESVEESSLIPDELDDEEAAPWSASMLEELGPPFEVWYACSSSRVSLPSLLVSMVSKLTASDGAAASISIRVSVPSSSVSASDQWRVDSKAVSLAWVGSAAVVVLVVELVVDVTVDWLVLEFGFASVL
jgi:hypothetical protein